MQKRMLLDMSWHLRMIAQDFSIVNGKSKKRKKRNAKKDVIITSYHQKSSFGVLNSAIAIAQSSLYSLMVSIKSS